MEPPLQKLIDSTLKLAYREELKRKKDKMTYKLLTAIKQIDYKDVAIRASWTFLQAFAAVFIFAGESIITALFAGDWNSLMTLLVATGLAAIAAGLSAVKTIVVEIIRALKAQHE